MEIRETLRTRLGELKVQITAMRRDGTIDTDEGQAVMAEYRTVTTTLQDMKAAEARAQT